MPGPVFIRPVPSSEQSLADRLWTHPFENGDHARDMTRRLAMEMGWSIDFARSAIEEYRRFCFLAVVCGHPVTPSIEVDAVWHLHLLHTRDYWEVFCPSVLGQALHHGPTQGGSVQQSMFYEQYAHTLKSYHAWFGVPPVNLWPPASIRFRPSRLWRWVFLPDFWVIPKPSVSSYVRRMAHALVAPFKPRIVHD